ALAHRIRQCRLHVWPVPSLRRDALFQTVRFSWLHLEATPTKIKRVPSSRKLACAKRSGANRVPLLVVCPHTQNLHNALLLQHLVDKPVLYVDAARVGASQIPDEFLVRWRALKRIDGQDGQQALRFALEPA